MSLIQDLFPTHGLTQPQRYLRALRPGYVGFDERQLPELLAYLSKVGGQIPFVDERDQEVGTWGDLLIQDVSVLLALMLRTDLKGMQQTNQQLVQAVRQRYQPEESISQDREKIRLVETYANDMIGIILQVQPWQQWSRRNLSDIYSVEGQVGLLMKQVAERQLRPALHRLRSYERGAGMDLEQAFQLNYDQLDAWWGVEQVEDEERIFEGDTLDQRLNRGFVRLQLLQRDMFDALVYLIARAETLFAKAQSQKSDHAPNIGLLMAFLDLYGHLQADLNGLLHQHLGLYYRQVLGQSEQLTVQDRVFLCMDLDPAQPEMSLPAGTRFDAGTDAFGNDVFFATERPASLNRAQLASVKTLFIGRNTDDITGKHEIITGIYAAPVANSADGMGKAFPDEQREWSLFGEEQSKRLPANHTMVRADVGFALSSPVLFLAEGKRQVRVNLQIQKQSADLLKELLLGLESGNEDDDLQTRFYEVFPEGSTNSLELWLTATEGWFRVDPLSIQLYAPDWEADPNFLTLSFSFELNPGDPPIVAFQGNIHDGVRYATRFPVLRVLLAPLQPYPYSFLADLELSQVQIEVEVSGLREFSVYGDLGEVDTSQPFQPFGPQPKLGSYMLVGHVEFFRKRLNELSLQLEWMDLPGDGSADAFTAHYSAFKDVVFDPTQYYLRVSALSEHRFLPDEEEDQQLIHLFTEQKVSIPGSISGTVQRITRSQLTDINLAILNIQPSVHLSELPPYSTQAEQGYVKFELASPAHAFGHHVFSEAFTQVAQENAQKMISGDESEVMPFPAQPYTPQVKGMTASYRAEGVIRLGMGGRRRPEEGSFFHILPFGTDKVSSQRTSGQGESKWHILPGFPYAEGSQKSLDGRQVNQEALLAQDRSQGYLYLGLKEVRPPQAVSLLFHLSSRYTQSQSQQQIPQLLWCYLSHDHWQPIEANAILEDGTDTFTRTGIITIQLPADINDRNQVMPAGHYWLRVAVQGSLAVFCQALDIHTQAVEAQWVGGEDDRRLAQPLPAGSITRPEVAISAIRTVEQPYDSFGGKQREQELAFFQRISERLSHKQRAVSARDFERLVLQAFPDIFQAKCLTYQIAPSVVPEKGQVVVVVAPRQHTFDPTVQGLTPKVNFRTLQAIETYLQAHASPYARILVRNPSYEYLRVVAKVRFIEGQQNGYGLAQLQADLIRYICPWYEDSSQSFPIGKSMSEEDILNFVKGLDYVKFITSFSMIHIFPEDETRQEYRFLDTAASEEDERVVIVPKAWSVLVPDEMHEIELIAEEREEPPHQRGNKPVRFQRRVDLYPSQEQNRHVSQKASLVDATKLSTRTEMEPRYHLKIKLPS